MRRRELQDDHPGFRALRSTQATLLGVVADVGFSAGLSDLSGSGGVCAGNTISLGAGRYAGAQITFRQSQDQTKSIFNPLRYIDGVTIGLGLGVATPISLSRGF